MFMSLRVVVFYLLEKKKKKCEAVFSSSFPPELICALRSAAIVSQSEWL